MKKTSNGIIQTIYSAKNLYERNRDIFFSDLHLVNLLSSLENKINTSRDEMFKSGIVNECKSCALQRKETCCTYRTGFKCDTILLLINLLMQVSLPEIPFYNNLCHFLTEKGCCLKARPVLCVNYTCHHLRENISFDKLIRVQEITGHEMDLLFTVENYIKQVLRKRGQIYAK